MKKEVEMKKASEPKNEKLTYEQLENVCHQLSEQSRNLYQKLQEADLTYMFKRLDYLFAVVENREAFPNDFTDKCIKEIISGMTVSENSDSPEEAKTDK